MSASLRIAVLHTGDELLLGLQLNRHLLYFGEQFARHGVHIDQAIIVGDSIAAITTAFHRAWAQADILIITGGLGPTVDDNTKLAVAEALGLSLEYDVEIEASISQYLAKEGQTLNNLGKKQCYKPSGFEALKNPMGTAPGLWFSQDNRHLILLPGPTQELQVIFEDSVLPRLKQTGLLEHKPSFLSFKTAGIPEVELATLLQPLFEPHAGLGVAYCAHLDQVDVRLHPGPGNLPWTQLEKVLEACQKTLGEDFLGVGNVSLPQNVLQLLQGKEASLSVAESCTGGLLAHMLTDIPGASKHFSGGVVSYNNDMKIELLGVPEALLLQHGAVSAEVAVAMAAGVAERFSTPYALSTTGFAGPEGGSAEAPVGTVFIGYYAPTGIWARRLYFSQSRRIIKERATYAALDWIRRELLAENPN